MVALESPCRCADGELFDLDYDLLLYDVTSTYFGGAAAANPQAMHDRFERRIELKLEAMVDGCGKRKQDPLKVAQQVGRLLGKNSRAAGSFQGGCGKPIQKDGLICVGANATSGAIG
jgi:hypothetical protein